MSRIIYHLGTGTHFLLDDDVFVIDTDEDTDVDLMDSHGDEIAVGFGKRITHIITEELQ